MNTIITDSAALNSVEPYSIRSYLNTRGWKFVEAYGNKGDVYGFENAPEIVAPASSEYADYAQVVGNIIQILGEVEGREQGQILRDLNAATADVIRVRAPEAEQDGSISIDTGVTLLQQSRDLLLAAACSAVQPKAAFRAGSMREATEYLNDVRIGQSERGSYVVTLLSPVPPSLAPADLLEGIDQVQDSDYPIAEPFERRVTYGLIEALNATREAISLINRGGGIEVFHDRVKRGISAILCQSIASLADAGEGVDISLAWALNRPPRKVTPSTPIRFNRSDSALLQEAANLLRSRELRSDIRLEGLVTRLHRDEGESRGKVTVKAIVDNALRSVSLELDDAQYQQMVKAHKDLLTVSVEGDLKRTGHRWSLMNTQDITLAPDEEDRQSSIDT